MLAGPVEYAGAHAGRSVHRAPGGLAWLPPAELACGAAPPQRAPVFTRGLSFNENCPRVFRGSCTGAAGGACICMMPLACHETNIVKAPTIFVHCQNQLQVHTTSTTQHATPTESDTSVFAHPLHRTPLLSTYSDKVMCAPRDFTHRRSRTVPSPSVSRARVSPQNPQTARRTTQR